MRTIDALPSLSTQDLKRLGELEQHCKEESSKFIGYPCNAVYDYSPLFQFLRFSVNNIGDPFLPSNYHINSLEFEREVLEIFRKLTAAPEDSFWGYVTNGGTEGNMYGLFLARELHPEGIVYYSEDTHYSVNKIMRVLNVRNIMIRSHPDGTMDLEDLRESINIHRDVPAIVSANIGTTMKGAIDDLAGIHEIIRDLAIQQYYIHADAALSGMILPFVDDPQPWNFQSGIDSISISSHKMVGSPIPCGVAVAKKSNVDRIARSVEYVGTLDTTMTGSRNGITPLFLWYAFRSRGMDGYRKVVRNCLQMADYAIEKLQSIGRDAWRNKNSVTVVFPRPSMEIISRWQIAAHHEVAHIITMPHVTTELVDRVVEDIRKDRGTAPKGGK